MRHHEEEDEEQRTKETIDTEFASTAFHTKLTDVNADCHEIIFMHLALDDLLNIAHTSGELKAGADEAFKRKFATKTVDLEVQSGYRRKALVVTQYSIKIYDLQTSLRFVRCFGHLTSKLRIFGTFFSPFQIKIVRYVNEFCSKSLTEVWFICMSRKDFQGFHKPFTQTASVVFHNCTLNGSLKQLNKWFPKLQTLDMFNCGIDCIETHFPQLQCLKMKKNQFTAESITKFVRLNPQLMSLTLNVNGWIGILRNISHNLWNLEFLNIVCYDQDFFEFVGGDSVKCDQLKHLKIEKRISLTSLTGNIPISCDRLEEFSCEFHPAKIDRNIIDFLRKHQSISKLNLKMWWNGQLSHEECANMATALPQLQKIRFDYIYMSVDSVLSFIANCNSLKLIRYRVAKHSEFDRLKYLLKNEWEAAIDLILNVELKRTN